MINSLKYNLVGILTVICMVVAYTAEEKIIKLITGSLLIIALIFSLIETQRSIELSSGQKQLSWIILIPLLSLVGYLYKIYE